MAIERDENITICIFMSNIQQDGLPETMRRIIQTVTCLKWPLESPTAQKVFWLKLQERLEEGQSDLPYILV